jgi:flavorubredoxin
MVKINNSLYYLGASDYTEHKFERLYTINDGMAYNSYLLVDDKTVLFDTCDKSVRKEFIANLNEALGGRKLDYIVVHHMEPDHSYELGEVLALHPEAKIVISQQGEIMMEKYLLKDMKSQSIIASPSFKLKTGHHTLSFIPAPLVHWPEVIFSYDEEDHILFSADAFGTFGGNKDGVFASERRIDKSFFSEMRRYYTNIVGKFSPSVISVLNKVKNLNIQTICSLHGPIWNAHIPEICALYTTWASYQSEDKEAMIVVGSIYGHTLEAANKLKEILEEKGVKASIFDTTEVELSYLISEAFRVKTIIICSITYAGDLFPPVSNFLNDLAFIGMKNRNYALLENGSWAPSAACKAKAIIATLKDSALIEPSVRINGRYDEKNQKVQLEALATAIKNSLE